MDTRGLCANLLDMGKTGPPKKGTWLTAMEGQQTAGPLSIEIIQIKQLNLPEKGGLHDSYGARVPAKLLGHG